MLALQFTTQAWEEYFYWQRTDPKMLTRIIELIKESMRNPHHGIGKPEPLRRELQGYWSRRIDIEHRLVYWVKDGSLQIVQCRYHY